MTCDRTRYQRIHRKMKIQLLFVKQIDVNKFTKFLGEEQETWTSETIPTREPDIYMYLARFFLSIKKANQSECEPDTKVLSVQFEAVSQWQELFRKHLKWSLLQTLLRCVDVKMQSLKTDVSREQEKPSRTIHWGGNIHSSSEETPRTR